MATMATSLVETWQSCAFQLPEYAKSGSYSAVLSVLLDCEGPEVQELNLRGNQPALRKNRLGDVDTEVLAKLLSQYAQATQLDLSYNAITDTGITYLAEYLKVPNCSLRILNLGYNDFGAEGTETLASVLQFNSSVHTLFLNGCKIGHKGGIQVASMLQVNRTITRLGLANTDLDTDSIIAMATVLNGNRSLKSIDLSRPLLHSKLEESTIHISRMLQVNTTLRELHLSKHGITDTGAEWICRHLRGNSSLLKLDLSCNSLSRDGASHLATLLRTNSSLTTLDLSSNRIEDDGLVYISEALSTNCTLTALSVCHNSIGDRGLCRLAEALRRNSTLSHVAVWGNTLGGPTCNAFRELLESSRLQPENVDVRPYEVDGVTYLARTD